MTTLTIPGDVWEVTPDWLTDALRAGGVLGGGRVADFAAHVISEGKGFISQVARLDIEYSGDAAGAPASVILKLPSGTSELQMLADRLGHGRREVRFYGQVAGSGPLSAPRAYYCAADEATGRTVLLIEFLTGARQGDSVAGCSREDALAAIVEMARFHAHWLDSPRLDSLDWIPRKDDEAAAYQDLYAEAWRLLQSKAGEHMPEGISKLGDRLERDVPRIKAMLARSPRTLIHGDFRLDNCFFREQAGAAAPTVPIVFDWEFCTRGRGAYDVATFLSEAYTPEQRRAEEMPLLRAYHNTLVSSGAPGYSFEECLHDYRLSMLEVLVFWIVTGGLLRVRGRARHGVPSRLAGAVRRGHIRPGERGSAARRLGRLARADALTLYLHTVRRLPRPRFAVRAATAGVGRPPSTGD